MTPAEFLKKLITKYKSLESSANLEEDLTKKRAILITQSRTFAIIDQWISYHANLIDKSAMLDLIQFLDLQQVQQNHGAGCRAVRIAIHKNVRYYQKDSPLGRRLEKLLRGIQTPPPVQSPAPERSFKKKKSMTFLDIPPLLLAEQLTKKTQDMFGKIQPSELLFLNWKRKNKLDVARNVVACIGWFNHLSSWVVSEVLSIVSSKQRRSVIERFIQVAERLRQLHDYHSLVAVVTSLNLNYVKRLTHTWKKVSPNVMETFAGLNRICQNRGNWNVLRSEMQQSTLPIIPYLGITAQDLVTIGESPTFLDKSTNLVNFKKLNRIAVTIKPILDVRHGNHTFAKVPPIQEYLDNLPILPPAEQRQRFREYTSLHV